MSIPKEYMNIREYLSSYMEMQEISNTLENVDLDRQYKTTLLENNDYWMAILQNRKKRQSSTWNISSSRNLFTEQYVYNFYLDKTKKHVYLKACVKATNNINLNNYLFQNLFKKIHKEGIHNVEFINSEESNVSWSLRFLYLKIDFNIEGDYLEEINTALNIINKYNMFVFEKLINKWNSQTELTKNSIYHL